MLTVNQVVPGSSPGRGARIFLVPHVHSAQPSRPGFCVFGDRNTGSQEVGIVRVDLLLKRFHELTFQTTIQSLH